ncbi:MAG: hypothetical protein E6Q62_00875 [Nitrosomonas sp.]|nr:MAG: hypothetical protein E6Q62_00875 [Nitrosomonas sp.]
MKTPTLLVALFLALSLTVTSAFAVDGIDDNDHAALAKYYELLAKEAEVKLQENKAVLEEYENHSYYYGRQGQDLKSHTTANIREYEKQLAESLSNADLHHRIALEQQNNSVISKAKLNFDDSTEIR